MHGLGVCIVASLNLLKDVPTMIRTITAKYRSTCRATGAPIKPGDLIEYDTDSRATYLAHTTRTRQDYVSHVFNIGNREYYRNKQGRCEDAPCCGCCTI